MASAVSSPTLPKSAGVANAAGCCEAIAPASSASAAVASDASAPDRLGLESIDQLIARCEDAEDGEWWLALAFGFAAELFDVDEHWFRSDQPRTALWVIDARVRETARICTTGHRCHEETGRLALQLETAQQAVLDELEFFYQRQTRPEFETMATKTASTNRRTKTPDKSETDTQLLLRSLNWNETAWNRLRATGATDRQLLDEIAVRYNLAAEYGGKGTRHYRTRGGDDPAIWFDEVSNEATDREPDLHGEELLARVRNLLSIPQAAKSKALPRNGHVAGPGLPPALTSTTTPAGIAAQQAAVEAQDGLVFVEEREILVRLIDDSPYQTCNPPSDERVKEIAESIKRDGQLSPALVREVADGRFELIGGHTRKLAILWLAWLKLRCRVYRCSDATAARLVYDDNAKHRDLNVLERAKGLQKAVEVGEAAGQSQRDVADKLGVSQSFISNMVRMLDLPETIQARLLAGDLTQAQARKLSRWAKRPRVMTAFAQKCKANGNTDGPIEEHNFEAWLDQAVRQASRPMGKHKWGQSCEFTPTEAERAELDIEEITTRGGGKEQRAFNVALWGKRQKEAKAVKASRAAAKAKRAGDKPEEPKRDQYHWKWALERCWRPAYQTAIHAHLSGKKSKADIALLSRLSLFFGQSKVTIAKVMGMTAADFEAFLFANVVQGFGPKQYIHDLDDMKELAEYLRVDPAPFWKPTDELLRLCTAKERAAIADDLGVAADAKSILAAFPRAEIPALFLIDEQKPKKGKGRK